MNAEQLAIVATIVTIVVQAVKPTPLPASFLPLAGLITGIAAGLLLALAETGVAGLADGAVVGIVGALTAFGGYSGGKAMSEYRAPARDARGRFVARDDE